MQLLAGVIINLSGPEPRERYCTSGAYSYKQRRPAAGRRGWGQYEKALADYLALGDGDLVFFFENRRIYGTGRIVRLPGTERATLCNYPRSWDLWKDPEPMFLWDNEPEDDLVDHPFVVFFTPDPAWYTQGIDMDEALESDAHGYVRSLPFFSGVSFARIDAFEAAHLASLIRKANTAGDSYPDKHKEVHRRATRVLANHAKVFNIDVDALVQQYSEDQLLRHETLLEAWLIDAFRNRWELVRPIMGGRSQPTFVARQVPASPFKPPEYIDRIDLLAYNIEPPTPSSLFLSPTRTFSLN